MGALANHIRGQKLKAEQLRPLDIRPIIRAGLLQAGRSFVSSWTDAHTGERLSSVKVMIVDYDLATISFASAGGPPLTIPVALDYSGTNFGGQRAWFLCPCCAKRVAVIWHTGSGWGCRACLGLSYASQRADRAGRIALKLEKLYARLGSCRLYGRLMRPKGMWLATHSGILHQISYHGAAFMAAISAKTDRLEAQISSLDF